MLYTELKSPGSFKQRRRVGRGQGSGWGKTSCRGHKGQKARSGASDHGTGGQTPLYRQLPKMGFRSRKEFFSESVRSSELAKLKLGANEEIDIDLLRSLNLIRKQTKFVKVFLSGESLTQPLKFGPNITASKGVKELIEKLGKG